MGLCNSPDIFQENISEIMFVPAYIKDILVLTHSDWNNHITKLDLVFQQIQMVGLKVKTTKLFFWQKCFKNLVIGLPANVSNLFPRKLRPSKTS
jgi:hypothetical protein